MTLANKVKRLWQFLSDIEGLVLSIVLAIVTLMVVFQVILRYVFRAPLMGIEEMLLLPMAWLYAISAAHASQQRAHIDCGIITLYIKRPFTMKLLKVFRSGVSLGITLWLLRWAYWFFTYAMRINKVSPMVNMPMVWMESSVFFGYLLMSFFQLVEFADCVLALFNKTEGAKIAMTEEVA